MNRKQLPPAEPRLDDQQASGPEPELSEADLESVVGGLARPRVEREPGEWLLDPLKVRV